MSFYLTAATSCWYGEGRALELVWPLFPLITVEGLTNSFHFCEQNMLRRSVCSQVMDGINKVLSARNQPQCLGLGKRMRAYEGNVVCISDVLRRECLLQLIDVSPLEAILERKDTLPPTSRTFGIHHRLQFPQLYPTPDESVLQDNLRSWVHDHLWLVVVHQHNSQRSKANLNIRRRSD